MNTIVLFVHEYGRNNAFNNLDWMDVSRFLPFISFPILCFLFRQLHRRSLIQDEFDRLREPRIL